MTYEWKTNLVWNSELISAIFPSARQICVFLKSAPFFGPAVYLVHGLGKLSSLVVGGRTGDAGSSGGLYHVTLISSSSSFSVCSSGLCGLVSGLTSLRSILGRSPSASLRSGLGLFLFGNVCSREPPVASSSRSLLFRHFIRRFWNQIFTCKRNPLTHYQFATKVLIIV